MAKPRAKPAPKKPPAGPHALTLKGERDESRAMEAKESPAFEAAEKRLGIEGNYKAKRGTAKGKGSY